MSLGQFPQTRLRRLRQNENMRRLVRETILTTNDLIFPIFVKAGLKAPQPLASMPGLFQLSLNAVAKEAKDIARLGIPAVMVFGVPAEKDVLGSDAFSETGIVQQAVAEIKQAVPELLVMSDVCCCEYTSHGHCGVIHEGDATRWLQNDETLSLLQRQVVSHAKAGVDVMVPSGMIDGMVKSIRTALDDNDFKYVSILSHSMKYASNLYGPFREATEGAPQFGDRKSYQADYANGEEALREVALDLQEGADIILIKPALSYLDIIYRVKQQYPSVPIAAYHPSGE